MTATEKALMIIYQVAGLTKKGEIQIKVRSPLVSTL